MRFSTPTRHPLRVRAGVTVVRDESGRETRVPLYIHTTRVMAPSLARDLRSRDINLLAEESASIASSPPVLPETD